MIDPSPSTTGKVKEPVTLSEKLLMQRLAMRKDVAKLQVSTLCFIIMSLDSPVDCLQSTVARLAASHGPGTGVATEITTFPIPELSKVKLERINLNSNLTT